MFSDDCVSKEIKHHCLGYWYSTGKIPGVLSSYRLYFGSKITKRDLKEACRQTDIAEQDVFKNDSVVFGYFYGIRNKYAYTMADPFWYGDFERNVNSPRVVWKQKKIPCNAIFLKWDDNL